MYTYIPWPFPHSGTTPISICCGRTLTPFAVQRMATYFEVMRSALTDFGLGSAGRLYNFIEEVLEDDVALQHEVEGAVELGLPRTEVGRCLAWLRSRAACARMGARMDAERAARVPRTAHARPVGDGAHAIRGWRAHGQAVPNGM